MSKLYLIAALAISLFACQPGFAADVEVYLSGSNLIIDESEEFNDRYFDPSSLRITEINGYIRISGFNGTLVNGQNQVYRTYPAGDIVVNITRAQSGSLVDIDGLNLSGRSDDLRVTVNGWVYVNQCLAFTSWHSDISVAAHRIDVSGCGCERDIRLYSLWQGNNDIYISNSVVNDDLVITGNGRSNDVEVIGCWAADLVTIKLKDGNDELIVEDLNTESLVVDLGSGQDALFIDDTHPSDEWYVGGSGHDVVYQSERIVHNGNSTGIETIGK